MYNYTEENESHYSYQNEFLGIAAGVETYATGLLSPPSVTAAAAIAAAAALVISTPGERRGITAYESGSLHVSLGGAGSCRTLGSRSLASVLTSGSRCACPGSPAVEEEDQQHFPKILFIPLGELTA